MGIQGDRAEMEFDGIFLGAGHNAMVLQAYLGRAGLKTICLERKAIAGGGLSTMEDPRFPGFMHNTHSFFHRAIREMPWYKELELERLGARYLQPELGTAIVLKDDRVLEIWRDFEKTYDNFGTFNKKDADSLRRWRDDFIPILEKISNPESMAPPIEPERRRRILEKSPEGRLLLKTSEMSPLEFVTTQFDNSIIQAGLLFFNGLREVDLRCNGFGHHIPMLIASKGKAQMCVGGSASLARALLGAVQESGGAVLLNAEPEKILIEDGRAVGVRTKDGRVFRARKFVASGLNPHQTFLDLQGKESVSPEWKKKTENFKYNLIAPLFGLNLNLNEKPEYKAAQKHPELRDAGMVILGLEGFEQFPSIVAHHEKGNIPSTVMWGCCPTHFDPTQAPEGKHVAFMWEKLPYYLRGDAANWDVAREQHGQEMFDLWAEFAPNLKDATINKFVRSPLDTERAYPNMREGDLLLGAFTNGQIGYNRPFPGAGHYRGNVDGLYLCGASQHPGGNITGLCGYNAAQIMFKDLGLRGDWMPENIEGQLEKLGVEKVTAS